MGSIQIKNAPDDLHEQVRARAIERSMTVRDYILDVVRRDLARPTLDTWLERVHRDPPIDLRAGDVGAVIREGRDEREAELLRRHDRTAE
ncbi:MAG: hypothetical protein M3417_05660 [Actinomycetota bacterium]|nr:hypothetical protein [Actinomycetota bacterium]